MMSPYFALSALIAFIILPGALALLTTAPPTGIDLLRQRQRQRQSRNRKGGDGDDHGYYREYHHTGYQKTYQYNQRDRLTSNGIVIENVPKYVVHQQSVFGRTYKHSGPGAGKHHGEHPIEFAHANADRAAGGGYGRGSSFGGGGFDHRVDVDVFPTTTENYPFIFDDNEDDFTSYQELPEDEKEAPVNTPETTMMIFTTPSNNDELEEERYEKHPENTRPIYNGLLDDELDAPTTTLDYNENENDLRSTTPRDINIVQTTDPSNGNLGDDDDNNDDDEENDLQSTTPRDINIVQTTDSSNDNLDDDDDNDDDDEDQTINVNGTMTTETPSDKNSDTNVTNAWGLSSTTVDPREDDAQNNASVNNQLEPSPETVNDTEINIFKTQGPQNETEIDELSTTLAPQNETEIDELSTSQAPQNETEIDELSTSQAPQNETEIDELSTTQAPQNETEIDELSTTQAPQNETEIDELSTTQVPQNETEIGELSTTQAPQNETAIDLDFGGNIKYTILPSQNETYELSTTEVPKNESNADFGSLTTQHDGSGTTFGTDYVTFTTASPTEEAEVNNDFYKDLSSSKIRRLLQFLYNLQHSRDYGDEEEDEDDEFSW